MVSTHIEHQILEGNDPKIREYIIERPEEKGYNIEKVEEILADEGWNRITTRKTNSSPQFKYRFDDDLEVNGSLKAFVSDEEIKIQASGHKDDDSVPAGKRKLSDEKLSVIEETLQGQNHHGEEVWKEFYLEHRLPKYKPGNEP